MAAGSKTVKVVVSLREARRIMGSDYERGLDDRALREKFRLAVLRAFTDYSKQLKAEAQARNIVMVTHNSDEAKAIDASVRGARKSIDEQYHKLNRDEADAMERLTQSKLDEAGITDYRASGFGFKKVES